MNANITCRGGRAPPGRNTRMPCAESHWLGATPLPHAPAPSVAPARWLPRSVPAQSCESSCAASVPYNRSWALWNGSLPSVIRTRVRAHGPSVLHAHALQVKIDSVSPCSNPLKKWSLRESRGGSHRARAQPGTPQRFGDVLNSAHRYSRQVHLHQSLLDRALASFIPLDNRSLKRQSTQLRYPHLHLAGLALELALIVASSAIYLIRRPLVTLCPADMVCLRIQQPVQRLLDARPDNLIPMSLQLPFVDLQRSQHCQCIV